MLEMSFGHLIEISGVKLPLFFSLNMTFIIFFKFKSKAVNI